MPVVMTLEDLGPGLRLYQPLYMGNLVLLPAGRVLTEEDLDSLRKRFPNAHLSIADPVLDEFTEFENESHDQEVAVQVHRRLGRVLQTTRQKLRGRTAMEGIDLAGMQRVVADVMRYIGENPVASAILRSSGGWSTHLQEHPANVFYLSLLIGTRIRQYVRDERTRQSAARQMPQSFAVDLTPLAIGALFHDIGMVSIEHLYKKEEPLTAEELEAVRAHPIEGETMLPRDMDPVTRMVVRSHHERFDGAGYPKGQPGKKVHIFSRILRVADAYDSATSSQVYKSQARTPARALWEMTRGHAAKAYDPAVVRVFASLIQPFPIGAKIRLNCGRFGVVLRHDPREPFRPVIVIAFDEEGRRLPKKRLVGPIDLADDVDVRLEEFAGEKLDYVNHMAPPESQPAPEKITLFDCHFP
jgi:HD-GYP domain-containing protein (c-di-GMP phosphodiesterase class II)